VRTHDDVREVTGPRPSRPPAAPARAIRIPLNAAMPPEHAVLWLRGDERPFALSGGWLDGMTLLGSAPVVVAEPGEDPFAVLAAQPEVGPGEATVGGGWVGRLGYGLGARIERLRPPPPSPAPRPTFSLAYYDHVALFDGERWWFEALWTPQRDAALRERRELWQIRLRTDPPRAPTPAAPSAFRIAGGGATGHRAAVRACRERIAAGEIFQANICTRIEATFDGDPVDLFARALTAARPRFGAYLDGIISLSPERFLRRTGRHVVTEPIKGTRPRVGAAGERRAQRDALGASPKDAAEHVMIVDLMRNDLGRVCEYGTICARGPRIEAHAGVWHLTSTVSACLRPDVEDGELVRAAFPPGSVTGAPKVQAMMVIAELEATRRETYTGAIGIASPIAGLDLSVAIRTFELTGRRIWLGAGGGIVACSDPDDELAELLTKAAGPIAAMGGRLDPRHARPRRLSRSRQPEQDEFALSHGSRPDPGRGVFETVLVEEGRPVRLGEHLARLAASLAALYGARLDDRAAAQAAAEAAAASGRARLRIVAETDGGVAVTCSPADDAAGLRRDDAAALRPDEAVALLPFTLPGGLGAHKWRDRDLLDALSADVVGAIPLLLDGDGTVLEAAYANVWLREGENLLTPVADGRILPGVTRAALLASELGAREEPIDLDRLRGADAILLTSSIAGCRPARLATRSAAATTEAATVI